MEESSPKFSYANVKVAFDLLRKANLIEPAFSFRGQMRYKVKDDDEKLRTNLDLRNFLSALRVFHDEERGLLTFKWKFFEGPSDDEKRRWMWLLGKEEANRFFRDIELKRYENRKGMRQCKNTLEYHKFLNSICPKEFISPLYGPWPYGGLLYDFRRKGEEKKGEEKEREKQKMWQDDLDHQWIKKRRKRLARKKKVRVTKKDIFNDKIEYEQFLRTKLETQIEHLPINLENEGNQDFRIFFSRTLQKYPFLYQVMRNICPRIFKYELTDEEIEMGIIYNEIERRKAESLYGIHNPITKERNGVKKVIPDLTEKSYKNKNRPHK